MREFRRQYAFIEKHLYCCVQESKPSRYINVAEPDKTTPLTVAHSSHSAMSCEPGPGYQSDKPIFHRHVTEPARKRKHRFATKGFIFCNWEQTEFDRSDNKIVTFAFKRNFVCVCFSVIVLLADQSPFGWYVPRTQAKRLPVKLYHTLI